MRRIFLHPPRTGGSSVQRGWCLTRHEYRQHELPERPKPVGQWWYGFTRNPWDRVVSLYHLAHPTAAGREGHPFREWVLRGMANDRVASWRRFCEPTWTWLEGADWIGRFENRAADLARLARQLGRPMPYRDTEGGRVEAHYGASRDRRPYQEYFDDETAEAVGVRYAIDVAVFGYSFSEASV